MPRQIRRRRSCLSPRTTPYHSWGAFMLQGYRSGCKLFAQRPGLGTGQRPGTAIFGANVRRLRHARGLSQVDLAYEADVNRTYMRKLEKGGRYRRFEIIGRE